MSLNFYHRALLISLCTLLLVYADITLIHPIAGKQANQVIFLLHAIPVLICLGLVFRKNYRGFMWTSFVSLMMFCVAAANLLSGLGWIIYIETALTVMVFLFSLMAGRHYKQLHKQTAVST